MSNTLAIWLGALILGFFAIDYFVLDWGTPAILLRLLLDLIRWVAFWR